MAGGTGIRVSGADNSFQQKVIGNAVFAATPINAADQSSNISDSVANADIYLTNPGGSPTGTPSQLDLYPLIGTLVGSPLNTNSFNIFTHWDRDFNFDPHDGTFRGAYAGAGANPGWLPKLERKPLPTIVLNHQLYLPVMLKG